MKNVKLSKEFLNEIACNEELTKKDYRVFLYLLTKLDDKEYEQISQRNICAELYMDKSSVSKSINNLLEQGVISRDFFQRNHFKFGDGFGIPSLLDN
ncbi:MarR family transcriptional regulator [Bacillus cereus]|uniref:MarR family transcriptional regulator n=1 Tax=Bacillus cereus TaxID=1396 RepID=UPI0003809C42|nr:helix-turn-helix domain-containing protein [Bacillus cereus]KMP50162.1 hypothetical protein TU59_23315 [Bacillus cereus]